MSEQEQQSNEEFFEILHSIVRKWQKRLQKDDIFERKVDTTKQKHFITVPGAYAFEPFHFGHTRVYMPRDLFYRLKRQQSLNILWPLALHKIGMSRFSVSAKIKTGVIFFKNYV